MPEGVEVLIQANILREKCQKQTIIGINWDKKKFQKNGVKYFELVNLPLFVKEVWSRGKVIVFECLDPNEEVLYITSQLGMTGKWVFQPEIHSNFWFSFGCPHPENPKYWETKFKVWYDDQRHFGGLGFYRDLKEVWKRHGPCLMSTILFSRGEKLISEQQEIASLEYYRKQVQNKRFKEKRLAEFLMDQTKVSGVGNYIRAELLYNAKLSPERLLSSLSEKEIETLYKSTLEIMFRSYSQKGKYFVGEGCGEGFSLKVYKKEKDPNGYPILTFQDKNKRMCYYVKEVQK